MGGTKKSLKRKPAKKKPAKKKYTLKKTSSNQFRVTRWSKSKYGLWRNVSELGVQEWPINSDGQYKMRFFNQVYDLVSLPDVREFTNLFNWYQIEKCVNHVMFTWQIVDTGVIMTSAPPPPVPNPTVLNFKPSQEYKVASFIDKTNRIDWAQTAPTYTLNTENSAKQFPSFMIHSNGLTKNFTRTVHPTPLRPVNIDTDITNIQATAQGYRSKSNWLSTGSTATPHYAFVFGIRPIFPQEFSLANRYQVG